eukprot:gene19028-biopygen22007
MQQPSNRDVVRAWLRTQQASNQIPSSVRPPQPRVPLPPQHQMVCMQTCTATNHNATPRPCAHPHAAAAKQLRCCVRVPVHATSMQVNAKLCAGTPTSFHNVNAPRMLASGGTPFLPGGANPLLLSPVRAVVPHPARIRE